MKSELEIKESHDLETHLNLQRDLTGSLKRISVMSSEGMLGIDTGSESESGVLEEAEWN